jgi:hypothetical protein
MFFTQDFIKRFCCAGLVAVFLLTACGNEEKTVPAVIPQTQLVRVANDSMIAEAHSLVRTGDLVLRTGKDFSSEQVRDFSKTDKTYSHAGIALVKGDSIFVYHIEPDYYYKEDKVRKELLDSFCNPVKNYGIGIARYKLDEKEIERLMEYLEKQYRNKVAFDMEFSLKTNDKMYCSEMIRKGLLQATDKRIDIEIQKLNNRSKFRLIKRYFKVPEKRFVNMDIIPIDRLYLHPECTMIKQYLYEQ